MNRFYWDASSTALIEVTHSDEVTGLLHTRVHKWGYNHPDTFTSFQSSIPDGWRHIPSDEYDQFGIPEPDYDAHIAAQERAVNEALDQQADERELVEYVADHGVEPGGTCPTCERTDAGCTCVQDEIAVFNDDELVEIDNIPTDASSYAKTEVVGTLVRQTFSAGGRTFKFIEVAVPKYEHVIVHAYVDDARIGDYGRETFDLAKRAAWEAICKRYNLDLMTGLPIPKTAADVEELQRQWLNDPCFDLPEAEGFEAFRDELTAFQEKWEATWARERQEAVQRKMTEIGTPNEVLAQYVMRLENMIDALKRRVEQLERAND